MYQFEIISHSRGEVQGFTLDRPSVVIGNDEESHIRISNPSISSRHALISQESGGEIYIEDCGSTEGIFVRGRRIKCRTPVNVDDAIWLGDLQCRITPIPQPEAAFTAAESMPEWAANATASDGVWEAHLSQLREELVSLNSRKSHLESETQQLESLREKLARDNAYLMEDLLLARKQVEELIDLEAELKESIERESSKKSSLSRKRTFHASANQNLEVCTETEETICRELVRWLKLLEDTRSSFQNTLLYPKVARQMFFLEEQFHDILKKHSVTPYVPAPGEKLNEDSHSRVIPVPLDELNDTKLRREARSTIYGEKGNVVLTTLSPGYLYCVDSEQVRVLRKAEVVVK